MGDVPDSDDGALDPRIQIELENLNTATDEINRLEIALDEANTTFRILLNDCTRRLKNKSKSLGTCVEKARPYYEALEIARHAQMECQRAAVHFQRANEIHQAAKETVALAEQRFLSKQHEWQFDNAWQEMLNHATIKVRDAETQKAESGREHHKKAVMFNTAEQKVQQLEQRLHRHITKSKPYFDEKCLCNEQLAAQKERVEILQTQVAAVKGAYAASLRELERISEEIHCKRNKSKQIDGEQELPSGPREPGVGAELEPVFCETPVPNGIADKLPLDEKNPQHGAELEPVFCKNPLPCADKNSDDENKNVVVERGSQTSSPSKPAPTVPPPHLLARSNLTALPLLDNLAHLKNVIELPSANVDPSALHLPDSSQIFQRSNVLEDDENKVGNGGDEVLLNYLMENYGSELDRCDMRSLSGASIATGSSAVSEKDESESYLDEELEDLREQIHGTSLAISKTKSLPGSSDASNIHSATHSPVKQPIISNSQLVSSKSCNNILGDV